MGGGRKFDQNDHHDHSDDSNPLDEDHDHSDDCNPFNEDHDYSDDDCNPLKITIIIGLSRVRVEERCGRRENPIKLVDRLISFGSLHFKKNVKIRQSNKSS